MKRQIIWGHDEQTVLARIARRWGGYYLLQGPVVVGLPLSEMSALLEGVIFYVSTFIVLVGVALLWDVWRHKDSFEIAARSPVLLCLAGTAHVALVFLQMVAGVRTVCQRQRVGSTVGGNTSITSTYLKVD